MGIQLVALMDTCQSRIQIHLVDLGNIYHKLCNLKVCMYLLYVLCLYWLSYNNAAKLALSSSQVLYEFV